MLKNEKDQAVADAKSASPIAIQARWLRPEAAAEYSGLSRSSLYEEISAGRIRSYRVRGCRLIDREELDRYISSHSEEMGEGLKKRTASKIARTSKNSRAGTAGGDLPQLE